MDRTLKGQSEIWCRCSRFTSLLALLVQKYKYWRCSVHAVCAVPRFRHGGWRGRSSGCRGDSHFTTQFTCFTSTKVQILTQRGALSAPRRISRPIPPAYVWIQGEKKWNKNECTHAHARMHTRMHARTHARMHAHTLWVYGIVEYAEDVTFWCVRISWCTHTHLHDVFDSKLS